MKTLKYITYIILLGLIGFLGTQTSRAEEVTGEYILKMIDDNVYLDKAMTEATMTVFDRRGRELSFKSRGWVKGADTRLVEYLHPPRQKGVKMLMLEDNLWMYTPEPTDRIITISGHMLRQSLNGSDLSYEDMMENSQLIKSYDAKVVGKEQYNDRECWVVELTANREDVSYHSRKMWVDTERWLGLKEERYAKSGKLLKRLEILNVIKLKDRWYPKKMRFKDMLSKGKGTEYVIDKIDIDVDIPDHMFTKASLR